MNLKGTKMDEFCTLNQSSKSISSIWSALTKIAKLVDSTIDSQTTFLLDDITGIKFLHNFLGRCKSIMCPELM